MMLTEEQAKEKWCPFVHVVKAEGRGHVPNGQAAFNRLEFNGVPDWSIASNCIASQCMAWRWHRKPGSANLWKLTEADRETIARHVPDLRIDGDNATQDGRGYCGLASKPNE